MPSQGNTAPKRDDLADGDLPGSGRPPKIPKTKETPKPNRVRIKRAPRTPEEEQELAKLDNKLWNNNISRERKGKYDLDYSNSYYLALKGFWTQITGSTFFPPQTQIHSPYVLNSPKPILIKDHWSYIKGRLWYFPGCERFKRVWYPAEWQHYEDDVEIPDKEVNNNGQAKDKVEIDAEEEEEEHLAAAPPAEEEANVINRFDDAPPLVEDPRTILERIRNAQKDQDEALPDAPARVFFSDGQNVYMPDHPRIRDSLSGSNASNAFSKLADEKVASAFPEPHQPLSRMSAQEIKDLIKKQLGLIGEIEKISDAALLALNNSQDGVAETHNSNGIALQVAIRSAQDNFKDEYTRLVEELLVKFDKKIIGAKKRNAEKLEEAEDKRSVAQSEFDRCMELGKHHIDECQKFQKALKLRQELEGMDQNQTSPGNANVKKEHTESGNDQTGDGDVKKETPVHIKTEPGDN